MTILTRLAVAFLAFSLLGGCAQQQQTTAPAMLNSVCAVSGEPLDADSPTSDFLGGKVGFCCEKCQANWDKMDDGARKMALEKAKK